MFHSWRARNHKGDCRCQISRNKHDIWSKEELPLLHKALQYSLLHETQLRTRLDFREHPRAEEYVSDKWNYLLFKAGLKFKKKKSCNQTWNDITRICFREKMQNSFSRAKVLQMVCCWWSTAVQANQLGCSQWVENQNKWGDKITR